MNSEKGQTVEPEDMEFADANVAKDKTAVKYDNSGSISIRRAPQSCQHQSTESVHKTEAKPNDVYLAYMHAYMHVTECREPIRRQEQRTGCPVKDASTIRMMLKFIWVGHLYRTVYLIGINGKESYVFRRTTTG